MNIERLDKIIDRYIAEFDELTNDVHDENMKWRAIRHFKDNFDINAPDFHGMFKNAMAESSIIINNDTVQPINGILKLITHDEEAVRGLFIKLYNDEDHGDIAKRQERIESFVSEANNLLDKYECGKWKYKQNFRSALAYLTFYKPEENYLYKSSQCQPFFRYLEYGEEIGAGQYFKLSTYYRMCDEIKKVVAGNQKLMDVHNTRWEKVKKLNDDLHILIFDIIYCSNVYGFYNFENYTKVVRKSKADKEQERLEQQVEEIRIKVETLEKDLIEARETLEKCSDINVKGQNVVHRRFGSGYISEQNGSYIIVKFESKTSKFSLPVCFSDGHLTLDDELIIEKCHRFAEAKKVYDSIEKEIKSKQSDMGYLISKMAF